MSSAAVDATRHGSLSVVQVCLYSIVVLIQLTVGGLQVPTYEARVGRPRLEWVGGGHPYSSLARPAGSYGRSRL